MPCCVYLTEADMCNPNITIVGGPYPSQTDCQAECDPAGGSCADPIVLPEGEPYTTTLAPGQEIWFRYEPPPTAEYICVRHNSLGGLVSFEWFVGSTCDDLIAASGDFPTSCPVGSSFRMLGPVNSGRPVVWFRYVNGASPYSLDFEITGTTP